VFHHRPNRTATDPWGGHRAGFNAAAKISRKDFGIVWNKTLEAGGLLLGEDVMLDLQVEAVEAKPSDASKESQNSKDAKNSAKGHKKK
jgi:polyisoprenoid-binding protein YceI